MLGKVAALVAIAAGVYELYDAFKREQARRKLNTYVSGGYASPQPGTGTPTGYYTGGSPEATVY